MSNENKKGRPRRYDADYFPHYCNHNRILEIIMDKQGNKGYGFYYRLQELLGKTPGHGYDANNELKYEYLLTQTGVDSDTADEIIALLCDFDELDAELWREYKIIWWDKFVETLKELYSRMKNNLPTKEDFIKIPDDELQKSETHKVN